MVLLCDHLNYFLRHHSTDYTRGWIKLHCKCSVNILSNLFVGDLIRLESIMALGKKNLLQVLLGLVVVIRIFLEVLADECAEEHLGRVSCTFFPTQRLRLVKDCVEEFSHSDAISDFFVKHLVLLVWVTACILVLKV